MPTWTSDVEIPSLFAGNSLGRILDEELPDTAEVRVRGDFTDGVHLIASTSMSTVLSFGRPMDSEDVLLLPHVQVDIRGAGPNEDGELGKIETFMSKMLPLESAAYLLTQLAADFSTVSKDLLKFDETKLKPEILRVRHARFLAAHAAKECLLSVARLNVLLDSYPKDEEDADNAAADEQREPKPGKPAKRLVRSSPKTSEKAAASKKPTVRPKRKPIRQAPAKRQAS